MFLFNVRVYGMLINHRQEVLISDEQLDCFAFTKFPGGGLEYGEGLIDALKREYMEECGLEIEVVGHVYTTDFYEKSSFNESQILSVYYQVRPKNSQLIDEKHPMFRSEPTPAADNPEKDILFRLLPVENVNAEMFTFKTDQVAWKMLIKQLRNGIPY